MDIGSIYVVIYCRGETPDQKKNCHQDILITVVYRYDCDPIWGIIGKVALLLSVANDIELFCMIIG
jgi:hypothetical protein